MTAECASADRVGTITMDAALQDAFAYTFPLYEMARTRHNALHAPAPARSAQVNQLRHRRTLSDHRARAVTTPNNDTLYSSAWLDLSGGPLELQVPAMGARYWSVQFLDAHTGTAAVAGTRNGLGTAQRLWIAHADDPATPPAGMHAVRLPTRDAWLLARILVDGAQDLAAVHALQDGLTLHALGSGAEPVPEPRPIAPQPPAGLPQDAANFLAVVNEALRRNAMSRNAQPPDPAWQPLGVGAPPGAQALERWTQALPALAARLDMARGARTVRGWSYPDPAIGTYGADHALRAGVARSGLGALPLSEALYLLAGTDAQGEPLDGRWRYRVRLPAQGLEAKAFWSLSMYQEEADGRLFFVDNPIARYALGDRSSLPRSAQGEAEILVQHAPPDAQASWLPAPTGPFRLMLRAYLPGEALLKGQAPLPVIERLPPR